MEVIIAENAGFCQGVKKALEKTLNELEKDVEVVTYGPLVHNRQVVDFLENKGVKAIEDISEINPGSKLIIRSHGVGPDVFKNAENKGLKVVDSTCPFVKKVQRRANELLNQGYRLFIVGDLYHPEVRAINEWAYNTGVIISHKEMAKWVKVSNKSAVVSQTTFRKSNFYEIIEILKGKNPDLMIHETICDATSVRQNKTMDLALNVDIMIVIGGYNSSNTQKLKELSQKVGVKTYHIESAFDLNYEWIKNCNKIGVTAGASTPEWIIKEVVEKMNEFQKEEYKDRPENNGFEKEQVVKGDVVKIYDTKAFVDIGHKTEAILPHSEVYTKPGESLGDVLEEGQEIEAKVLRVETSEEEENTIVISKKLAEKDKIWEWLQDVYENGDIIEAGVVEEVKGGLIVYLEGIKGFIPASLVERFFVPDLSQYIGSNLRLKVIELDRSRNKVLLSQKDVLEEEYEQKKQEVLENVEIGSVIEGEVKRVTDFGAFIDIGGIDGLCHISEVSFDRVEHPSDVLQVGDKASVKVLNVDVDTGKVALSIKRALPDPWESVSEKFSKGDIVEGKVTRTVNFGAFVELIPGVEGLVHISQLADYHVEKTEDVVEEGDNVKAKILDINSESKRISLSIKEASENKEKVKEKKSQEKKVKIDDEVSDSDEDDGNVKLGEVFGNVLKEFKESDDIK